MKARILLDTPSESPVLGFDRTAAALAVLIEGSEPRFAVGIFGGWGSGKTTLMDAIRRELNREDTLKVTFNAWRYERESDLIVPLLDTIRGGLVSYANDQPASIKGAIYAAATQIGQVVRALASSVSAEFTVGVAKMSFDSGKAVQQLEHARESPPPQSLYHACFEQLAHAFGELREAGVARVVVFVDDLDRCLPQNALVVLESMKLFFDLTGFVFVVGIDRAALESAVRERLSSTLRPGVETPAAGARRVRLAEREYIKKIFQMPYELPPTSAEQLDELLECICRTSSIEGDQLQDLQAVLRPYLTHIAIDGQVNPREVKRFINAYTLQMLVRPHLDASTVLAVQTLAFRDDWPLYEILRIETEALPQAIKSYRHSQDFALADLWPEVGTLQTDLARFLLSTQAKPLERSDLRTYLTSVETTARLDRWVPLAYQLIGALRRKTRAITMLLAQRASQTEVERASRDLAAVVNDLESTIIDAGASERLSNRLTVLAGRLRNLHSETSAETAANWGADIETTISELQYELRLVRGTSLAIMSPSEH